jgi:hypothetical protein
MPPTPTEIVVTLAASLALFKVEKLITADVARPPVISNEVAVDVMPPAIDFPASRTELSCVFSGSVVGAYASH